MEEAYDIERIMAVLPHRYPFVLVDRVLSVTPAASIQAIKNVTINEPFFPGHFPGKPIMPGVLIIEGLVQAGALLLAESLPAEKQGQVCFSGIDKARFRKPVMPGDQLLYEVTIIRQRSRAILMAGTACVAGQRVAEAKLMAVIGGSL